MEFSKGAVRPGVSLSSILPLSGLLCDRDVLLHMPPEGVTLPACSLLFLAWCWEFPGAFFAGLGSHIGEF